MKVKVRTTPYEAPVVWPDGWDLPAPNDAIHIGDKVYLCREVSWYPTGDPHSLHPTEPFVYVVLVELGWDKP